VVRLALLAVLAVVAACGGKYGRAEPTRLALTYRILDARTGREVPDADAWVKLAAARAVCIGEEHPNTYHHQVQLLIVDELARRAKLAGTSLALGIEMVQRPFQGVLDDYADGRIDDDELVSRTGWADRWGYDFAMYQPIFARALAAKAPLIALNAPRELVKKMSRQGIDALTPEERAQVPELKLDDAQHRAWFDALMADMGGAEAHKRPAGPPKDEHHEGEGEGEGEGDADADAAADRAAADRIYAVQVLWDETMADVAAKWIGAAPGRAMILLAGNGHCHDSAIVNRIKRRGIPDAISVMPILSFGENLDAELAAPRNDYLFVMYPPSNRP
jgi:uncharacterized iron-regulated protein